VVSVTTRHVPILLAPIVEALVEPFKALPADAPPHWIVDCTLGGGGHAGGLLAALATTPGLARHKVLAVDQDASAIGRARGTFARELAEGRLELAHARFSEIEPLLANRPVLGLMADLGFSSDQLEDPARGLSFQSEGPLDMRLDPSRGVPARQFLSQASERELVDILSGLGEERFSNRIAAAITQRRRESELPRTTTELAELVVRAVPPKARYGRIHAATRTFQALRIAVNQELEELDSLLERVILQLKRGGRVAILSFHSLEDRKVKQTFKDKDSGFRQLTKKPVEANEAEVSRNPRSRSAKLRVAERL
jgi:16S rRNA (cytosine1402-N4)-methyltransferase